MTEITSTESTDGWLSLFITQTAGIFLDAYRELNSRRMFWVALILSGAAMALFSVVSVTDEGIHLAGYYWPLGAIPPKSLYKYVFAGVMIDLILAWAITILAIISTASIFPDFVSGGSVDLFISKPISRLRLFCTKYAAGMLFVLLQVTIFSVVAFFVVGLRGRTWEPGIFLAIPIITCFFSYLFAVSVLFGVLTRSGVASLLLTILFWGIVYGVHYGEIHLLAFRNINQRRVESIDRQLAQMDEKVPSLPSTEPIVATAPATQPAATQPATTQRSSIASYLIRLFQPPPRPSISMRDRLVARRDQVQGNVESLAFWHQIAYPLKVIVPKTSETIDLLDRVLLSKDEFLELMNNRRIGMPRQRRNDVVLAEDVIYLDDEIDSIKRSRSLAWILGTSLLFEGTVVGLAAWIFCRRDF